MDSAISIRGLNKKLGAFKLDSVSFDLPKGYVMGFIGPNGAGKTTTIKLILGMLRADAGEISALGSHITDSAFKQRIGVIMDQPFYPDDWTIMGVEKALMPFYRTWDSEVYVKLVENFGLDGKKKVKELSRGMKMKLMAAVAFSHSPELLLLDEPTSGLDAVARDELMDMIADFMQQENRSVLFSTHITTDLQRVADYITVINGGRIAFSGLKDDLMGRYLLVKGGDKLTQRQKESLIGLREHDFGFDALCETSKLRELPPGTAAEPCALDDIVIRFNRWSGQSVADGGK